MLYFDQKKNNDFVCFVLVQHAYKTSSLKQQYTGRYVAPLGLFIPTTVTSKPVFVLTL